MLVCRETHQRSAASSKGEGTAERPRAGRMLGTPTARSSSPAPGSDRRIWPRLSASPYAQSQPALLQRMDMMTIGSASPCAVDDDDGRSGREVVEDDGEVSMSTPSSPSASVSSQQYAGEETVTRTDERTGPLMINCRDSDSDSSSLVLSQDRTRENANGAASSMQADVLARIATLKALCDEGFITPEEYERRKSAIIDELTFASHSNSLRATVTQQARRVITRTNGMPLIVPHAPEFRDITPEIATKHTFDYEKRQWSSTQVYVCLDETPFSKGSLRVVYHLQDLNEIGHEGSYVAKVAIDPDEDPQTYFRDIELQAHCARYAELYNSYNPPKRVEFLKAWVLELSEREGTLCAVEEYIPGEYRKHNNNFGSVSDDERNTPQAFSHFTFEASNHELLAVDIQGVGDHYTDPQIHTLNGDDFGKGNLGVLGFNKFMASHRCNSICRYLKLPATNPKDRRLDRGTLPLQELMNKERIRPSRFDSRHYYEQAPMLQKYIAQCREMELREESESSWFRDCSSSSTWWCCLR